ncbi:MAG TPA: ATP synthase F1 subunit gamma [Phycisphaerae bacterium]|nr:ATP synthase F1 subunit gamma [Phycisphaerae bacterium]HSA28387.1 ATP synthase F1 subunit gamma [Phycisphaerae bacterium]
MAKARGIVKRRKAVQNIRKITRTMQLIATARFQAAYNRATACKPYTERVTQLMEQLSEHCGDVEHPLLTVNTKARRSVLMVLTSNRGLCGGYNAGLLRSSLQYLKQCEGQGSAVDIHAVGKKGIAYFRFLGYPMAATRTDIEDKPQFAQVEPIASAMIEAYARQEVDSVHVAYSRFESTARQRPETIQLLPLRQAEPDKTAGQPGRASAGGHQESGRQPVSGVFEFSPPAKELLADLLPLMVKARLFQCFMDAAVSEQVARMVAMKSATEAAGDMIRSLGQQYNRARQSQITMELLDIMGGANALA